MLLLSPLNENVSVSPEFRNHVSCARTSGTHVDIGMVLEKVPDRNIRLNDQLVKPGKQDLVGNKVL